MNRLEELIQELCPDGVEFVPLWKFTAWDKRFSGVEKNMQEKTIPHKYYLSAEFNAVEDEDGDIPYIPTGIIDKKRFTTAEKAGDYLRDGEIVCIPWGGTPNVKYHKGKYVTGDNRICTSLDTSILDNKFLFYCLSNKRDEIASYYRGAGIQHPSMLSVLKIIIPLPPLDVQHEIVRILDSFTSLTVELQAELQARKKQYEYYRDELLSVNSNLQYKTLGEIATIVRGASPRPIKSYITEVEDGINWIKIGDMPPGTKYVTHTKEKITPAGAEKSRFVKAGDFILSNSMSFGRPYILKIDGCIHDGWLAISDFDEYVVRDYLYYILISSDIQREMKQKASFGGAVQNLNADIVRSITIPIPPIDEQLRIVSILDRFDALCNDISSGLPAEIEARQKQYEYYRDKLLTFKELQ